MKVVNFPAWRLDGHLHSWRHMYLNLFEAFHELGYTIRVSPWMDVGELPEYVQVGIIDSEEHVYVFNHTHQYEIETQNRPKGNLNLFIKPSGPSYKHFTIDSLGYASHSSITYKIPNYKKVSYKSNKNVEDFYNTEIPLWKNNKINKWDNDPHTVEFSDTTEDIPDNHVLFLGQMPGDETVSHFSFGDHWQKFKALINSYAGDDAVVIKLHPNLSTHDKDNSWKRHNNVTTFLDNCKSKGYKIFTEYESLHTILPKTKVAIIENSTSGLECLMYEVPIISYGYPEYHWVTKDLRHAINLTKFTSDISWYDNEDAKAWLTWYCKEYACNDKESTLHRLKQLI